METLTRRRILEWRDECLHDAQSTLMRLNLDLNPLISGAIKKASLLRVLFTPKRIHAEFIAKMINDRLGADMKHLTQIADAKLAKIHDSQIIFDHRKYEAAAKSNIVMNLSDIGSALALIGSGIYAIFAFSAMVINTTTTGRWVPTTEAEVDATKLLVLAMAAALLMGVGLKRALGVKARAAERLSEAILKSVEASIIGEATVKAAESELSRYSAAVEAVVSRVKLEIKNDPANTV